MDEYEVGSTIKLTVTFKDYDGNLINPTTVTLIIILPSGSTVSIAVDSIYNEGLGIYYANYTITEVGDHTYTYTGETPAIDFSEVHSGFFAAVQHLATDIDALLPQLRLYLGDITEPFRYTTPTLRSAVIFAIKVLMRKWRSKYKIDSVGTVTRNPNYTFEFAAPPTIQYYDEPPIIVQAAIVLKSGIMQEASWQVGSWRDDEIQVSNIEANKARDKSLERDIEWLDKYFKRRLFTAAMEPLPGFEYPPNYREG